MMTEETVVEVMDNGVEEVLEDKLALRVITHVVERKQIMWAVPEAIEGAMSFVARHFSPDEDVPEGALPVVVLTENPDSYYFATQVSNAGQTHRLAFPKKEYVGLAKRLDTENGVQWEEVSTFVHDGRGFEITIKGAGVNGQTILTVQEDDLMGMRAGDDSYRLDFSRTGLWTPGYATSSQTRKAEMVAKPSDLSYADYFKRIGFNPELHMTKDKSRPGFTQIKSLDKMSKRVKQTASSSRPRNFMTDFSYDSEEVIPFKVWSGLEDEYEENGTLISFNHSDGKTTASALILEDFQVRQDVTLEMPAFAYDETKAIDRRMIDMTLDKAATDGYHIIDRDFAFQYGLADERGELRAGEQFRWGQSIKGFVFLMPGLKSMLDVDMVLFAGGIKGDARVEFRQNFPMPFSILNHARLSEVNPSINLSRQVLSAIQTPDLLEGLEADTLRLIEEVLSFKESAIQRFLSIETISSEEDSSSREVDIDQLTTFLYANGKETFLKSHTMRKKLSDLLSAALKKFTRGSSLYLKDASFKHMLVDPYTIVQYLRIGELSAVKSSEMTGIKEHHVLTSELFETEEGMVHGLDYKEKALFRFPFLHLHEGRLVNKGSGNPFNDASARGWYRQMARKGYLQGLIFYSLWDMNPEAQSGADFDGDQTVCTSNEHILNNFNQQPLFLDYSYVEDEDGNWSVVSGCPFPGSQQQVTGFLSESEQAFVKEHDITITGDSLSFPSELIGTDDLNNLVGHLGAALARHNLVSNDIGNFTNVNSTIFSIMAVLYNHMTEIYSAYQREEDAETKQSLALAFYELKKEHDGYDNLSFFLACAIRWEIDKAKHGGAYRSHMPFLDELFESPSPESVLELEGLYQVSIQRLLFGRKLLG